MGAAGTHVFISYKHGVDPDERLARQILDELSTTALVFMDQLMLVGVDWGRRIEQELNVCDYLIALLSPDSIRSEMVRAEIATAHQLSKAQSGHPIILPVRVAYHDLYPYPLSAYLNSINSTSWESPADAVRVIHDLQQAVSNRDELATDSRNAPSLTDRKDRSLEDSADPLPSAGIPRDLTGKSEESPFYVERDSDIAALRAIKETGVTVIIRAAVQMGKSHLLTRMSETAILQGKRVAIIDFQLIDSATLRNPTLFFQQFCARISEQLSQEIRIDEYWNQLLGNVTSCTRYLEKYVMPRAAGPVTLIIDELDNILQAELGKDFVSMLRSWHNLRLHQRSWQDMDLVVAARTEPYMWLDNPAQSPFNVGTKIELTDLSPEQVADLNQRYKFPLSSKQIPELMALVAGHPYLIRRFLYLVSLGRTPAAELFRTASSDDGPFSDHLHYHLFHLSKEPTVLAGLRSVIRHSTCEDEGANFRLTAAGLVRREGNLIVPRCGLYEEYFKTRLTD